jgi:SsrA-binding protein
MSDSKGDTPKTIANNRKAYHDYAIEDTFEAGMALEGWEVKSIRDGRIQLKDSHIVVRRGEMWLLNANITPLSTVSTHITPDPTRTRKCLLHRHQIEHLMGKVEQKGYTIIPLSMYWKNNRVKVEIALAKGKKMFDKRASLKERDWQREKDRLVKKLR